MNVISGSMKKIFFVITAATIALCSFSSCSEDEDPDWIVSKYIISRKSNDPLGGILKSWKDTIYNKPEEYVMAEVALFQSKSDNYYKYVGEYRKF